MRPSSAPSTADSGPARVLIATRSAGKMSELRALFAEARISAISLDDAGVPEVPVEDSLESAPTYEENALAKARYFQRLSGMTTVADDSGLEVRCLGGAPGVRSKRWSARPDLAGRALDDANNLLLLERLAGHPDRRARYVCAAAFSDGITEFVERGEVDGHITVHARGTEGFGYDPYFESIELGRTFGEVTAQEKARVSHRARAFSKLLRRITPVG